MSTSIWVVSSAACPMDGLPSGGLAVTVPPGQTYAADYTGHVLLHTIHEQALQEGSQILQRMVFIGLDH